MQLHCAAKSAHGVGGAQFVIKKSKASKLQVRDIATVENLELSQSKICVCAFFNIISLIRDCSTDTSVTPPAMSSPLQDNTQRLALRRGFRFQARQTAERSFLQNEGAVAVKNLQQRLFE
ncbi:MAG: hypothetical protein RSF73_03135 [Ruthenibacterium sp.]